MTVTTPPQTRTAPVARRAQWLLAARWVLTFHARMALWFWGIALVVAVGALALLAPRVDIEMSAVQFVRAPAIWFPFGMMIALVSAHLTPLLGNGMTRRAFVRGALLAALVTGIGYSIVVTLGIGVEGLVYDALGWRHVNNDGRAVLGANAVLSTVGAAAYYVAGTVSGLLVGVTYYRFGGLVGTLTLPLSVSPVLLTSLLVIDAEEQWRPFDITIAMPNPYLTTFATLAIIAFGAAAFRVVTLTTPVRPVER